MGASGAVAVLYAREAKEQADPAAFLAEKEAEYTRLFGNPYNAAKYGYIDDVIEPAQHAIPHLSRTGPVANQEGGQSRQETR